MTVYFDFYDLDTSDTDHKYTKTPVVTPGDLSEWKIRKGFVDFSRQAVAAAQVANAIKIYAGEVVHDVWSRVVTAESTTNAAVDVGFNGGAEVAADFDIETANNFNANVTFVPTHFAANNAVTLTPNNAVACNTGKVEVSVMITKAFSDF